MKVSSSESIKFIFRNDSGYCNASSAVVEYCDLGITIEFAKRSHINPMQQWEQILSNYGMPDRLWVSPPGGTLEMSLQEASYELKENFWASDEKIMTLTTSSWEWDGLYASLVGGMSGVGNWELPNHSLIQVDSGSFLPSNSRGINMQQYREMLQNYRDSLHLEWSEKTSAHLDLPQEQINEFWSAQLSSQKAGKS